MENSTSSSKPEVESQKEALGISFARSPAKVAKLASRLWIQRINQHLLWIILPAFALLLSTSPNYVGQVFQEEPVLRGFLWGVLCLASYQLVRDYILYLRSWLKWSNKQANYRFDTNGVHLESEILIDSWSWESFLALQKRPNEWLLYSRGHPTIILPTQDLSEALKNYITHNITEAGGRVM